MIYSRRKHACSLLLGERVAHKCQAVQTRIHPPSTPVHISQQSHPCHLQPSHSPWPLLDLLAILRY
jgi:hypothetical protein